MAFEDIVEVKQLEIRKDKGDKAAEDFLYSFDLSAIKEGKYFWPPSNLKSSEKSKVPI